MIKGLLLSEEYYRMIGAIMIEAEFPAYRNRIAVGLAGLGSECFGFDDDISRDHDWGPGFAMWLEKSDYEKIGSALQKSYDALPGFMGFHRQKTEWGDDRVGVLNIDQFYSGFIGLPRAPETFREWLSIPETSLAACTNGKVFADPLGTFSSIREKLLAHYPEDIRLKKMAARCMSAAQSGQYNLPRSIRRNEAYAVFLSISRFCEDALSLAFLLNRKYMPFYKWAHRAARELPVLGDYISAAIEHLIREENTNEKPSHVETICSKLAETLRNQGLSDAPGNFLLDHGPRVHSRIQDKRLKELDVWWAGP